MTGLLAIITFGLAFFWAVRKLIFQIIGDKTTSEDEEFKKWLNLRSLDLPVLLTAYGFALFVGFSQAFDTDAFSQSPMPGDTRVLLIVTAIFVLLYGALCYQTWRKIIKHRDLRRKIKAAEERDEEELKKFKEMGG